ncbi:hypothetical protein QTO34_007577 [Cnephaeus nilssonii]|uniref:Uncharacterized protein n=1 Tax=Cnephaeus nilssonii TaxID=3371016 RepID=A0AA40HIN8_CNENI|nr:hypothetical protein QTO34_007577 [Eptesicus nilssonii]
MAATPTVRSFPVRAEQSVEKEAPDTEGGRVGMRGAQAQRLPANPFQEQHRCPRGPGWLPRVLACWGPGDFPAPEGVPTFQSPDVRLSLFFPEAGSRGCFGFRRNLAEIPVFPTVVHFLTTFSYLRYFKGCPCSCKQKLKPTHPGPAGAPLMLCQVKLSVAISYFDDIRQVLPGNIGLAFLWELRFILEDPLKNRFSSQVVAAENRNRFIITMGQRHSDSTLQLDGQVMREWADFSSVTTCSHFASVIRKLEAQCMIESCTCRVPYTLSLSITVELGACLLVHQAFRKPPAWRRLPKGLVLEQTGTQLPAFDGPWQDHSHGADAELVPPLVTRAQRPAGPIGYPGHPESRPLRLPLAQSFIHIAANSYDQTHKGELASDPGQNLSFSVVVVEWSWRNGGDKILSSQIQPALGSTAHREFLPMALLSSFLAQENSELHFPGLLSPFAGRILQVATAAACAAAAAAIVATAAVPVRRCARPAPPRSALPGLSLWQPPCRGKERDRELETSMREKQRSAAFCTPPTGDVPATKAPRLAAALGDGGQGASPVLQLQVLEPRTAGPQPATGAGARDCRVGGFSIYHAVASCRCWHLDHRVSGFSVSQATASHSYWCPGP